MRVKQILTAPEKSLRQEAERLVTCLGWRWGERGGGQEMSLLPEYELESLQMWLQQKMDQKDVMEGTENSYHTRHLYTGYWQERLELGGAGITFCGQPGPQKKRETGLRWVSPLDSSQIDQPGKSHHLLREEKVKQRKT